MSRDSSKSGWLERKLEATRRRVNQLEIDACKIRTELARIEVANATGAPVEDEALQPDGPVRKNATEQPLDWQPIAEHVPDGMELLVAAPAESHEPSITGDAADATAMLQIADAPATAGLVTRSRGVYRRLSSPVMTSVVVHAAVIFVALSITVATIERTDLAASATLLTLGEKTAPETENVELAQFADLGTTGVQNAIADLSALEASSPVEPQPIPIEFDASFAPEPPGKMGLDVSNDANTGQMPSGNGGSAKEGKGTGPAPRGGKPGGTRKGPRGSGRAESTMFFGTEARGNRFVFVVDNSSSMKGGRLEMAVSELIKTVGGLSPRQSFYVIFVSDKTYAMFYPNPEPNLVAATPANKQRLAEWAPKAILASGKNRELIKAMDLAASLNPQAVYLLWDGDLKYSESVRLDVLTHLTEPNQWNFAIHTLGMGSLTPNSEQNLRMISQAHHGAFRRIDVPAAHTR
jgi:hypothetical protein